MKILVTGGLGYIGSHTCVELLNNNYEVVVVDNLSNSKIDVVNKIETISNKSIKFYQGDVCSKKFLKEIFEKEKIDGVIHFAGYKAVGESIENPLEYYQNNLDSTINLCSIMRDFNCKNLIFSSSATVYGNLSNAPFDEKSPIGGTTNPYGTTKLFIEQILNDLYISDNDWNIIILRYFNPIGAHTSVLIGEEPNGIPNNLMPYICKVAIGELDHLNIFGNDYDTKDGTCIRDYVHVMDLARGHVLALEKLLNSKGIEIYNLGTGIGYSVLDVVNSFEHVNKIKIPYVMASRRAGDIDCCYADTTKALRELGFKTKYGIEDMVRDSYKFYQQNKK